MSDLSGIGVSPGMGIGPIIGMGAEIPEPSASETTSDAAASKAAARDALAGVGAELIQRGAKVGGEVQKVLEAQALMTQDPALIDGIDTKVGEGRTAERAVWEAFQGYMDMLAQMGDYFAGRVADLADLRTRTVARLLGMPVPGVPQSETPYVLVARDLAPADTAMIDKSKVLAFVTDEGGPTAHTAILAKTLGIPAIVACPGATSIPDGTPVIVDGQAGTVRINPTEDEVAAAQKRAAALAAAASVTGPGRTADGHKVPLYANVGGKKDVPAAVEAGAEGVGLFRTEFLFLDSETAPTVEQQYNDYKAVLEAFPGKRVVVRLLDAGADKPLKFLTVPDEPNPALGERGFRMLRQELPVLESQLEALRRAAEDTTAQLDVMVPMVSDVEEAEWWGDFYRSQSMPGKPGIMIEVPSAAIEAANLIQHVEFFSIGTNDLAQYTLAADRMIGPLAKFQDPWQPPVLKLINTSIKAANAAAKKCGVCGEAASDPVLACVLVGMGVGSLSMSSPAMALVRATLAAHTKAQCEAAAEAALAAPTGAAGLAAARAQLPGLESLGL